MRMKFLRDCKAKQLKELRQSRRHGWRWIAHVASSMASWVCPTALVTALGKDSPGRSRCWYRHTLWREMPKVSAALALPSHST